MSNITSVVLVVPCIARDLARAREGVGRWSALAHIAGRGAVSTIAPWADLDSWRVELLRALGLGASAAHYPEAPVMAAAAGAREGEYWLRATPMHFAAGLNDLTAIALAGEQRVRREEATELAAALGPHLRTAGFEFETTQEGVWLLRSQSVLEFATATPLVAARNLAAAMPTGRDAAPIKRLMTELQMLMATHPVNAARTRAGLPEINAVWLHGGGATRAAAPGSLPQGFGDDLYLRGLYRLHGQSLQASAADADDLMKRASASAVAMPPVTSLDELETRWLVPLLEALRSRRIAALELVLDQWRLMIDRAALLKFWRGARPVAQWPA